MTPPSSVPVAVLLSPFAKCPAFPDADYYGDSAPRSAAASALDVALFEGPTAGVPMFTDYRLSGEASCYTPTGREASQRIADVPGRPPWDMTAVRPNGIGYPVGCL